MKPIWLISSISVGIIILTITGIVVVRKVGNPDRKQTSELTSQVDESTNTSSSKSSEKSLLANNNMVGGEYWCRSYNYNGAGGNCQLQRPLILNTDGSYSFGTTSGKYTSFGDKITFDGELASRGPATYTKDKEIRWEFTQNNAPYTITYYLRSEVN